MKNVVITGTSRGIGYELVQLYGAKNYNVICLTRDLSTISNSKNISVVSTDPVSYTHLTLPTKLEV